MSRCQTNKGKAINPSYIIRSMPANPHDSVFCLLLGHNAVHVGIAGLTNTVVPIPLAISRRKQIETDARLWNSVLALRGS